MSDFLPLSPRYRLDDEQPWLVGIDPIRRYWIQVNGEAERTVALPGLCPETLKAFREAVLSFRAMVPGMSLSLPTAMAEPFDICCVSENCFAVSSVIAGAEVSHLFDRETLESLLMTAHPDWRCSPEHVYLGRRIVSMAWQQPVAEKVA